MTFLRCRISRAKVVVKGGTRFLLSAFVCDKPLWRRRAKAVQPDLALNDQKYFVPALLGEGWGEGLDGKGIGLRGHRVGEMPQDSSENIKVIHRS